MLQGGQRTQVGMKEKEKGRKGCESEGHGIYAASGGVVSQADARIAAEKGE